MDLWEFMVKEFMVREKNLLFLPSKETTTFTLNRVNVCIRLACSPGFMTVSKAPYSILAFFLTLWETPVEGSCWSPRKQAQAAFFRTIFSITAADCHLRDNSFQDDNQLPAGEVTTQS